MQKLILVFATLLTVPACAIEIIETTEDELAAVAPDLNDDELMPCVDDLDCGDDRCIYANVTECADDECQTSSRPVCLAAEAAPEITADTAMVR